MITDENNQPLVNSPVSISAESRTAVYVNHLYYIVDSQGIDLTTDEMGSVTVIEWINSLTGTKLNVTAGSATQNVNPMDKPFQKIAALNSYDSLTKAEVIVDDQSPQPTSKNLVGGTCLRII